MKYIITSLCLFAMLTGCAALPKTEVTDSLFVSESPKVKVDINMTVYGSGKKGNTCYWDGGPDGGVAINIYKNRTLENKIDYYYSLEHIVKNANGIDLGSAYFNDHKWLKHASFNSRGYLQTGYYTRKRHHFIRVFRYIKLNSENLNEVGKYRKDHNLTVKQREMLNEAFRYTDRLFTIIH